MNNTEGDLRVMVEECKFKTEVQFLKKVWQLNSMPCHTANVTLTGECLIHSSSECEVLN